LLGIQHVRASWHRIPFGSMGSISWLEGFISMVDPDIYIKKKSVNHQKNKNGKNIYINKFPYYA